MPTDSTENHPKKSSLFVFKGGGNIQARQKIRNKSSTTAIEEELKHLYIISGIMNCVL